ncbi:MAG TPA: MlaD family protein [Bacteroidia bacterium]|nr:MlaD family protein [Bacteroidia bacterium]
MKLSKEVKVGIVTTIAIGCFLFGFNFLKGKNWFSSRTKYYAVYKDISGLVEANPFLLNGYKIGMVSEIKLFPDTTGRILVTLVVNEDIQIPKTSVAKVASSSILGDMCVQLFLGKGTEYVQPGDTLLSAQEDNLKQAVNKTIAPLQEKATSLISSIDSVMVVVQEVLNEDTRKNLKKSFESIKHALSSLEVTSYRLDTMVIAERSKISSILSKVNVLATTLSSNSANLSNIISNFSNISDSLAKSNLTSAINNADVALSQASSIMTKINKGEGTMGMLINNDSLYRNLNRSSEDLDKLLEDLRLNPQRYVQVSVFGKKDKTKKK